ncbi:MAG: hypothetical protein ACTHM6_19060, partial [Tepidisphaeraceae bacterium]
GEEKFRELCRSLGRVLVNKNFNLISGFGLGGGSDVITGAMQSLPRNDDERLQLWPFPQELPMGVDRAKFWKEYRQRMISEAGISLVLSGNKQDGSKFVAANGVEEEINITLSESKIVVPIGATGYAARALWEKVAASPKDCYGNLDVTKPLATLGNTNADVDDLVKAVVEILNLLNK